MFMSRQQGVTVNACVTPACHLFPFLTDTMPCRIFISLRFAEAGDAGRSLKEALEACGVPTFLCDIPPGGDLKVAIVSALDECDLAIVMGTKTYGQQTTSNFSTFQEMEFIVDEQKPFFLVKMCDKFEVAQTRFNFPGRISYYPWDGAGKVPDKLLEGIVQKLNDAAPSKPQISVASVAAKAAPAAYVAIHGSGGGSGEWLND
jgi:hypothetical protein